MVVWHVLAGTLGKVVKACARSMMEGCDGCWCGRGPAPTGETEEEKQLRLFRVRPIACRTCGSDFQEPFEKRSAFQMKSSVVQHTAKLRLCVCYPADCFQPSGDGCS